MAKIARKYQKIFALANDASQRFGNGQFGSGKTGTKVITNDVEQLQLLAAFDDGWKDAVLVNGAGQPTLPPLPEMQTLDYIETYQLAYLFQEGVPEYNADTTYFINSIVKAPGTYNLYGSIIDDNIGNSISDPTKWKYLVNLSTAVMTANTASIANEIVLYDGTGGRDIKRATTTGILKGTSGVLSAATDGTDYYSPSTLTAILTAVYPIGSYYINETNNTNPATLFGFGTWVAITDKFIVAHGSTYTSTGGAATVTLGMNNLPSTITGTATFTNQDDSEPGATVKFGKGDVSAGAVTGNINITNSGGGTAFGIIPPYQAAYIWKRTV